MRKHYPFHRPAFPKPGNHPSTRRVIDFDKSPCFPTLRAIPHDDDPRPRPFPTRIHS
jgi:hypothetical protein